MLRPAALTEVKQALYLALRLSLCTTPNLKSAVCVHQIPCFDVALLRQNNSFSEISIRVALEHRFSNQKPNPPAPNPCRVGGVWLPSPRRGGVGGEVLAVLLNWCSRQSGVAYLRDDLITLTKNKSCPRVGNILFVTTNQ